MEHFVNSLNPNRGPIGQPTSTNVHECPWFIFAARCENSYRNHSLSLSLHATKKCKYLCKRKKTVTVLLLQIQPNSTEPLKVAITYGKFPCALRWFSHDHAHLYGTSQLAMSDSDSSCGPLGCQDCARSALLAFSAAWRVRDLGIPQTWNLEGNIWHKPGQSPWLY